MVFGRIKKFNENRKHRQELKRRMQLSEEQAKKRSIECSELIAKKEVTGDIIAFIDGYVDKFVVKGVELLDAQSVRVSHNRGHSSYSSDSSSGLNWRLNAN